MSPFRKWLTRESDLLLCAIRKFWRPLVCISIGGMLFVNGIVLPLAKWAWPDLLGLAAMITAAAPFAWIRMNEKIKGVDAPRATATPSTGIDGD